MASATREVVDDEKHAGAVSAYGLAAGDATDLGVVKVFVCTVNPLPVAP